MRAIFGLVLLVGVALAGGAVMMAQKYISQYQAELARERQARAQIVPTVDVYVATKALRYGQRLDQEDVRVVKWPENAIPEGSFVVDSDLFPADAEDNRFVLRAIEKDEAIMSVKVTAPGEAAGLTSQLERGMRALALKVDVASGVSGFLRPGDKVDVYWTGGIGDAVEGARGEITRLIDTNLQLIAVDQIAGQDVSGTTIARTVTVAATSEQIAGLLLAQNTGRLSLALVGAQDDTVAAAIEVDQRKLLGLGEIEAAPVVEEERVCTVKTRRGAEVAIIPIPCTN